VHPEVEPLTERSVSGCASECTYSLLNAAIGNKYSEFECRILWDVRSVFDNLFHIAAKFSYKKTIVELFQNGKTSTSKGQDVSCVIVFV